MFVLYTQSRDMANVCVIIQSKYTDMCGYIHRQQSNTCTLVIPAGCTIAWVKKKYNF